jgi:hypothetical protein
MAMAAKQKRVKPKVGDILRIDLDADHHAYAQVAGNPLIIFFEGNFTSDLPIEDIPNLPVAFSLWVYNYAVEKGVWPVIGHRSLTAENEQEPFFYKQDIITGRLFLYHSSFAGYERAATLDECAGLECAAVWEPEQVVDRLRDHAAGHPNEWVEGLRINTAAIP